MAKNKVKEDNSLGILAHLLGLVSSFIGPLTIYLVSKDKTETIRENAKHALNFQISWLIYLAISFVLMLTLPWIGFILYFALYVFDIIVCVIGCVEASKGKVYEYPLEIKFVK